MQDPAGATSPAEIAGHPATTLDVDVGPERVRLCAVPRLEDLVDRDALLRGAAEPPYWAYLWSGARLLASYVARYGNWSGRRVLEIGCGLGLPGITAAVHGADVTFVDAEPDALAFVAESAAANRVMCRTLAADFMRLDVHPRFDVVLAAEVAYDRERFPELAAVVTRHLLPTGVALLADGYRTDTRGLYRAVAALGWDTHAVDVRVPEEGRPIPLRLSALTRRDTAPRPA